MQSSNTFYYEVVVFGYIWGLKSINFSFFSMKSFVSLAEAALLGSPRLILSAIGLDMSDVLEIPL